MEYKFISKEVISGRVILLFEQASVEGLSEKAHDFFINNKYKLKQGGFPGNGVYEHGNYILRLLFGAFVRYFKFNVEVNRHDERTIAVKVEKGHSGFSGGVIGMVKLNKELKKLGTAMEQLGENLGSFHTPAT